MFGKTWFVEDVMDWIRRGLDEFPRTEVIEAVNLGGREIAAGATSLLQGIGEKMEPLGKQLGEVGESSWERIRSVATGGENGGRSMLPARFGDIEDPEERKGAEEEVPVTTSWAEVRRSRFQ